MTFWGIVAQILLESIAETLQDRGYCDNRKTARQRRISTNNSPIGRSLLSAADAIDATAVFVSEHEPLPDEALRKCGTKVLEAQVDLVSALGDLTDSINS